MAIGRTVLRLAACETVTPKAREAIRAVLKPMLERVQYDLGLALDALDGPDPEYGLSLYVDLIRESQGRMRALESALSHTQPVRLAV